MAGIATRPNGIQHLSSPLSSTEKAIRFARSCLRNGFYGSITLKIENGRVTHIREERTYIGTEIPQPDNQESNVNNPVG